MCWSLVMERLRLSIPSISFPVCHTLGPVAHISTTPKALEMFLLIFLVLYLKLRFLFHLRPWLSGDFCVFEALDIKKKIIFFPVVDEIGFSRAFGGGPVRGYRRRRPPSGRGIYELQMRSECLWSCKVLLQRI